MPESAYTLVIVESPTVARLLNRFQLPWVEVLPTRGFCWRPFYNRRKDTLGRKAVPERLDERNRIRRTAQWAARIVIATDTDSSGTFLAWALAKELSDHPLHRGNLQGISEASLRQLIDEADPLSKTDYGGLEQRFQLHELATRHLKPRLGNLPLVKLALISALRKKHAFRQFGDGYGNRWITEKSLYCPPQTQIEVSTSRTSRAPTWKPPAPPPSTSRALQILRNHDPDTSFSRLQERLNHLFTSIPAELNSGLISYPRTSSEGFYPETWKQFLNSHLATGDAEQFPPRPLWSVTDPKQPHESIHPLGPHSPADIRPHIPKILYDDYRMLYAYHQGVLSPPKQLPAEQPGLVFKHAQQTVSAVAIDESSGRPQKLFPLVDIARLTGWLTKTGVASPSKAGQVLDELLEEGLLHWETSGRLVVDKSRIENASMLVPLFDDLQRMQQNGSSSYNKMETCILDHLSRI